MKKLRGGSECKLQYKSDQEYKSVILTTGKGEVFIIITVKGEVFIVTTGKGKVFIVTTGKGEIFKVTTGKGEVIHPRSKLAGYSTGINLQLRKLNSPSRLFQSCS